jgi:hypothetical protein
MDISKLTDTVSYIEIKITNSTIYHMETMLLKEKEAYPTNEVVEIALGKSYKAFEKLMKTITAAEFNFDPQWNYYNDGKAWLCKVVYKKKTIFWLSVWDGYFKTGFYFTEKNCSGIDALDIDVAIIKDFKSRKPIGKLLPLAITIENEKQIDDVLKVAAYKKELK